ncbi:uncharacterized protein LOC117316304 [Pecten maximus]|uniref:uncharacterized protein LOC117316304 n=1 Tax=Pecten maximus TaxID=6579 RepID=UPI0014581C07|nr:uncharacterized protein LOC117316304 [Pecten maximus]
MAGNYGRFQLDLPENDYADTAEENMFLEVVLDENVLNQIEEIICETNECKNEMMEASITASSTLNNDVMKSELSGPADPGLGKANMPTATVADNDQERFRKVTAADMNKYLDMNQSKSTKANTKWGMKIFQDWHTETYGNKLDMAQYSIDELKEKLGKFYCEARPKNAKTNDQELKQVPNTEYHKNTLKNIRAAINRHFHDLNREIDIVNGNEFKKGNKILDGLLKERMTTGQSRATKHKDIIELADLTKISSYFERVEFSPFILRRCVWFNIAIHFVTRGLECHHQLSTNSFEFKSDESGIEYVVMSHETRQKNFQGGLTNTEASYDKRMYANNKSNCPVKMLRLLLEKTDPNSTALFNQCVKEAIFKPEENKYWYNSKALGKSSFSCYMPDISKYANCTKRYTAHCLRATAINP